MTFVRALLLVAAWLGMMGAASAFSAGATLGAPALRRSPLCASRAAPRSAAPRAAALAVRMQEDPPSPIRQGLVALAPIAAVALFVEYVAAPLMLDKLKAEKAEKAAKEAQK